MFVSRGSLDGGGLWGFGGGVGDQTGEGRRWCGLLPHRMIQWIDSSVHPSISHPSSSAVRPSPLSGAYERKERGFQFFFSCPSLLAQFPPLSAACRKEEEGKKVEKKGPLVITIPPAAASTFAPLVYLRECIRTLTVWSSHLGSPCLPPILMRSCIPNLLHKYSIHPSICNTPFFGFLFVPLSPRCNR